MGWSSGTLPYIATILYVAWDIVPPKFDIPWRILILPFTGATDMMKASGYSVRFFRQSF